MVRRGLPWFVGPITLFGLTGTMAHYFLSVHEPRKAALLLLGRQLVAMPLFVLLPALAGLLRDLPGRAVRGSALCCRRRRVHGARAGQAASDPRGYLSRTAPEPGASENEVTDVVATVAVTAPSAETAPPPCGSDSAAWARPA